MTIDTGLQPTASQGPRKYTLEEALICVDTLCRALLGRPAEGEGWRRAAEALHSGRLNEEEMATNFLTSPEFQARGTLSDLSKKSADPIMLQTSDPFVYRRMLDATSPTVLSYCQRHQLRYESYTGIKRGVWPWHAVYNRLFMLKELLDRGFRGWAVYLDADAFIVDQNFDLRRYLADKNDYAFIGVLVFGNTDPAIPGNGPHNINDGVFLINLGHPIGRAIVEEWLNRFVEIPEYIVRQAKVWGVGMASDNALLCKLLKENGQFTRHIFHESSKLINSSHASFIRQHLRAMYETFDDRLAAISTEVKAALGQEYSGGSSAPDDARSKDIAASA